MALTLEARDIKKSYGALQALKGVSFDLRRGEIHALCGHNGAGKSTLVRIITGQIQPDEGELLVEGEEAQFESPRHAELRGIAVVDQELSVVPSLTVEENLMLGSVNSPWFTGSRSSKQGLREALSRVGLNSLGLGRRVESLSMGERQLLEIARGLSRGAKVLVLDEPTASLSRVEIVRAFSAVRAAAEGGCAVIFVSHRLDEVMELCNRVTVMRDGMIVDSKPITEIERDDIVTMMVGKEAEAVAAELAEERVVEPGKVVVSVKGLAVPDKVEDFELELHQGEIVALAGQLGSGTEEVLRALAGLIPEASGRVEMDGKSLRLGDPRRSFLAGIQYVSGDRKSEGVFLDHTVGKNLTATRLGDFSSAGWLDFRGLRTVLQELARVVGLDKKRIGSPVRNLSGGNQQKVFIGRTLDHEPTHAILLDEPTRGVDVMGRNEIHKLLRRAADDGKAVLYTSTELDEILDLADRVITMFDGEIVRVVPVQQTGAAEILADMTHRAHTANAPNGADAAPTAADSASAPSGLSENEEEAAQ